MRVSSLLLLFALLSKFFPLRGKAWHSLSLWFFVGRCGEAVATPPLGFVSRKRSPAEGFPATKASRLETECAGKLAGGACSIACRRASREEVGSMMLRQEVLRLGLQ